MRTVLYNCGPIVCFDSDKPLVGQQMLNDGWIKPAGLALIVNNNTIESIQDSEAALDDYESHLSNLNNTKLIDINKRATVSYTHLTLPTIE